MTSVNVPHQTASLTVKQVLQQAIAYHQAGQLQDAERLYRAILQAQPSHPDANHNLGVLAAQMNQSATGLPYFKRALEANPSQGQYWLSYIDALIQAGQTSEAQLVLERGRKQGLNGMAIDALTVRLEELSRSEPNSQEINTLVALFAEERYAEAETLAHTMTVRFPLHGEGWKALGVAFEKMGKFADALDSMRKAAAFLPSDAEAHHNLGIVLQNIGYLDDALASFRRALEIKPDYAKAYGNMGGVLKSQGKMDEALVCFQQQARLSPGDTVAHHHIAALTGNNTERAPIQYVEDMFDFYADKFDTHLQQVLKYDAPENLVALITRHVNPPAKKWNVLDLGCGTGLVGLAIAPFAQQLVGIDLSAKMLEKAYSRNLYQRLERSDLLTTMQGERASSYDVIIAADVFVYLGKLDETFSEIKRLLCPGGVFAFSIETLVTLSSEVASQSMQREYQLEKSGRYNHSSSYITRLASANGFVSLEVAPTQIRVEKGKPVDSFLVLLKN